MTTKKKPRYARGERNGNHKLKDWQRRAILKAPATVSDSVLARRYGLHVVTVYRMRKNRRTA